MSILEVEMKCNLNDSFTCQIVTYRKFLVNHYDTLYVIIYYIFYNFHLSFDLFLIQITLSDI